MAYRFNPNDEFDVNNPAPKPNRSTDKDVVGDDRAYINKHMPDFRINRETGYVTRRDAKCVKSFPPMSQEAWDRMMAK